jgi:glycosyltransferase involved in cell wall biosynthesis
MPPLHAEVPAVVTVHDLTHRHFYTGLHRYYYDSVLKKLFRRCRAIICVSAFTRSEFIEWSGIPQDRVFLVYNGVSKEFFGDRRPVQLPYPYALYPGNRRRYKNLERLLRAYAASRLPKAGIHLMFTGEPDQTLMKRARNLGVIKFLHFAGSVSDDMLMGLYRGATLVVFVSLYEGFGLPILEGMAAGTPVVTSDTGAMREISGGAAVLVNPFSVESIALGMERISFDASLRVQLINKGKVRAAEFDWGTSSEMTWKIIRDAA